MSFETNPVHLQKLLERARDGELKLPEFQRSWVWDHERIRELIASVTNGFPVGALMTLKAGGEVEFETRPIEGAPPNAAKAPVAELLLDGQQRTTSLFRAMMSNEVVVTKTPRGKPLEVWFYFDVRRVVENPLSELLDAIVVIPKDKIIPARGTRAKFDVTSRENEVQELYFPINRVFDWDEWQDAVYESEDVEKRELFREFKNRVLNPLKTYQIPVISLGSETSREAVCLVFEKVNTGGKPLDAFELVTAMFAAQRFDLRRDWSRRWDRLKQYKVLRKMENTDFLQAIALFHTREERHAAEARGLEGRELPPVSAKRSTLLALTLESYEKYADQVENGFVQAAKFLHTLHIFKAIDLPYKTQVVPLAAILADMGNALQNAEIRRRLTQWYWRGVFGELYGSATDTRNALDFVQVPEWLTGGDAIPATVASARFRPQRLAGMKTRVSAAYKGLAALLMAHGATDWLSGQKFEHTMFFEEDVDIHHVFPVDWFSQNRAADSDRRDSIVNKAPLAARTNRIIGGAAPSIYLARLQERPYAIVREGLGQRVDSHLIEFDLLEADDFDRFYQARYAALLGLISEAVGPDMIEEAPVAQLGDEDYPDEEEQEAA